MSFTLVCAANQELLFAMATLWHSVAARAAHPISVLAYLDRDVDKAERQALATFGRDLGLSVRLTGDASLSASSRRCLDRMCAGRGSRWRSALARVVLFDELGPEVRRALYVDVDAIAVTDVTEAGSIDLQGTPVGAVLAPLRALHARAQGPYFNSGVLLVDVPAWQAQGLSGRVADAVRSLPAQGRMLDQDALNRVLGGPEGPGWHPLDPSWNVLTPLFLPRGEVAYEAPDVVRVLHFAGPDKPWADSEHPFASLYARHLDAVPFRPMAGAGGLFGHG